MRVVVVFAYSSNHSPSFAVNLQSQVKLREGKMALSHRPRAKSALIWCMSIGNN
jgi:hypothetical protein